MADVKSDNPTADVPQWAKELDYALLANDMRLVRMIVNEYNLTSEDLMKKHGPLAAPIIVAAKMFFHIAFLYFVEDLQADPDTCDEYGASCLMHALEMKGDPLMAMIILERYSDRVSFTRRDKHGDTVLHIAVMADLMDAAVVERLIQCGVDFTAKNKEGRTAIYTAVMLGKYQLVPELLKAGAVLLVMEKAMIHKYLWKLDTDKYAIMSRLDGEFLGRPLRVNALGHRRLSMEIVEGIDKNLRVIHEINCIRLALTIAEHQCLQCGKGFCLPTDVPSGPVPEKKEKPLTSEMK